jgi:hypothetical protein
LLIDQHLNNNRFAINRYDLSTGISPGFRREIGAVGCGLWVFNGFVYGIAEKFPARFDEVRATSDGKESCGFIWVTPNKGKRYWIAAKNTRK